MGYYEGMTAASGFDNTADNGMITVLYKYNGKVYEREIADFVMLEDGNLNPHFDRAMKAAEMDLETFSKNFVENFNKFRPDDKIQVFTLVKYDDPA